MDDVLTLVSASLQAPIATPNETPDFQYPAMDEVVHTKGQEGWVAYGDAETGVVVNEIEFDDTGEGVGVEGDLDMDDD